MNGKSTRKFKITFIIMLAVILAGMAVLGIFGLNNTADFSAAYEVHVGIDQNIDGSPEVVDTAARDYFTSVGVKISDYATQTLDDGATYVYKLNSLGDLVEEDLQRAIDGAIADSEFSNLVGSVDVYSTAVGDNTEDYLYVLLAIGIAVVAYFIYSLIAEKAAGGVAVLCVSVFSALVYISFVAITRVPEAPVFGAVLAGTIALSSLLAAGMCNRFRETEKLVTEEKLTPADIAQKGASMSVKRMNFMLVGFAAAAVAFAVCGILFSYYLAFFGAHLLIAAVSAYFTSMTVTPAIWSAVKGTKAKK